MGRVSVFLKDKLLDEVNEAAREEGTTRSALIRAALQKYLEGKCHEREEERRWQKMQKTSSKIDALAKKLGKWKPQATIRKFRDGNLKGAS